MSKINDLKIKHKEIKDKYSELERKYEDLRAKGMSQQDVEKKAIETENTNKVLEKEVSQLKLKV